MKIAAAMIRVSTSKQLKGTSPEKQIEAIRHLADEQGFSLTDEHTWLVAESGGATERVGFRDALEAASSRKIVRIYVYSIDRLGRNLLEMLIFLRDLEEIGIECWEAEKKRQLSWNDFMLQVEGAVAGKEREEIRKRTQDGLERAIRAGKYSGGIIAYGYCLNPDSKKLEIDDEEAKVVEMIFDWCVDERLSCVKIADRLNAMCIPTRYAKDGIKIRRKGKRSREKTAGIWRAGRIRNMLKNPAYKGTWTYGKRSKKSPNNLIPGYSPAIVSSDNFHRAAKVLEQNQLFSRNHVHRKYLLRGLIKCAHCGLTYCGTCWEVQKGKLKKYYTCNGRTQWKKLGKPKCMAKSVNGEALETVVWKDVKAFITNPEIALQQLKALKQPPTETLDDQLLEVCNQIKDLRRRERNMLKIAAKSQEVDPEALDEVMKELHQSLASLEAYKSHLEDKHAIGEALEKELLSVVERLTSLRSRIENATFEEKRQAIVELVKGISVETQEIQGKAVPIVTITYRFDEPLAAIEPSTMILDRMHARADTLAIQYARALAVLPR